MIEYKIAHCNQEEFQDWKEENVYNALKEYAKGFQKGHNDFLKNIIDNTNNLTSSEIIRLQKIKDYVSNPFNEPTFSERKGNDNVFVDWYEDGIKGGYWYKAWYLILENHIAFEPLFEKYRNISQNQELNNGATVQIKNNENNAPYNWKKNLNITNTANFDSFDEMYNEAFKNDVFGKQENQPNTPIYEIDRQLINLEFNEWLQQAKGLQYGDQQQYKAFLTKEVFKDFLRHQKTEKELFDKSKQQEKASWNIEPTQQTESNRGLQKTKDLANLITHKNSFDVVENIKTQYKNIKGKRLKLLMMALQQLELLPKERIAKKFHNCCKTEFEWDIASYTAMNDYLYNEITDKEELENMKSYLTSLSKTK